MFVIVCVGVLTFYNILKSIDPIFDGLCIQKAKTIATEIINEESNSSFPNHHPDPCVAANQKQLQDKVLELHADLGIGFDGDGDRCGIVDNLGHIIPTDIYMAIMCKDIILNNEDKRILYDVKCSNALKDEIVKWGGVPICYRTGASYTMAACPIPACGVPASMLLNITARGREFCTLFETGSPVRKLTCSCFSSA